MQFLGTIRWSFGRFCSWGVPVLSSRALLVGAVSSASSPKPQGASPLRLIQSSASSSPLFFCAQILEAASQKWSKPVQPLVLSSCGHPVLVLRAEGACPAAGQLLAYRRTSLPDPHSSACLFAGRHAEHQRAAPASCSSRRCSHAGGRSQATLRCRPRRSCSLPLVLLPCNASVSLSVCLSG